MYHCLLMCIACEIDHGKLPTKSAYRYSSECLWHELTNINSTFVLRSEKILGNI